MPVLSGPAVVVASLEFMCVYIYINWFITTQASATFSWSATAVARTTYIYIYTRMPGGSTLFTVIIRVVIFYRRVPEQTISRRTLFFFLDPFDVNSNQTARFSPAHSSVVYRRHIIVTRGVTERT